MRSLVYSSSSFLLVIASLLKNSDAFVQVSRSNSLVTQNTRISYNDKVILKSVVEESSYASTAAVRPGNPPDMEAYASGYTTVFDEVPSFACTTLEGEIPSDLVGTYFRCGPAMFSAGSLLPPKRSPVQPKFMPEKDGNNMDRMVKHPFEGDGAVLAVSFSSPSDEEENNKNGEKEITSRFRYIRTKAFETERKRGMKLYTGMESSRTASSTSLGNDFPLPLFKHHLLPGLNKLRKNTSNTRAIYFSKKLLTTWEGGLPYKLDSLGLSTEGKTQLGGVIKKPDVSLSSKACYDSAKEQLAFYDIKPDSGSTIIKLYEFNSKFRPTGNIVETKFPGYALLSDFSITQNYAVFIQPPIKINSMQFMLSKDPVKSFSIDSAEKSLMHFVKRNGNGEMKTIELPSDAGFLPEANVQFINSFEDTETGNVIIDLIRSNTDSSSSKVNTKWPWASTLADYQSTASKKTLWRYIVDVKSGSVKKIQLSDLHVSFGQINQSGNSAQKHEYIYANVGGMGTEVAPPQGIAKFDLSGDTVSVDAWFPKEYEFCGEPMYAPRTNSDGTVSEGEDDGYILTVMNNGKSSDVNSELLAFSADNLGNGPIARLDLGSKLPHGLFGCFASTPEAGWSFDEVDRRARLADKMESKGSMWNEVKSDFSGLGLRLDDFEEYFGDIL